MAKRDITYQAGDKVRIRTDLKPGERYGDDTFVGPMSKLLGKEVTIERRNTFTEKYKLREDFARFNWTPEMFEDPGQTVVIYRKGRSVIAYNKSTKARAEARCNPEDAFDFSTGAKLALNRLLDMSHGFKLNDIVIGTEAASRRYCITGTGFIARVIDVSNNTIIIEALNGRGGAYSVDPQYFRLATDEDITLTEIRDLLERK